MAAIAMELSMFTFEWVVCLLVVIELPEHPAIGIVTLVALLAEALVMIIVRSVAGHTAAFSIAIFRIQVTGLARGDVVHSDQWKPGQIVIEEDLVVPSRCIVATGAILSLLAFVDIIGPMAIDTGG